MKIEIMPDGAALLTTKRLAFSRKDEERRESSGIDPEEHWIDTVIDLSKRVPTQYEPDLEDPNHTCVFFADDGGMTVDIPFHEFDTLYRDYLRRRAVFVPGAN